MKNPQRKHTPKYGHSSKKRIRRKGVSDTEGNYDMDGVSQDQDFEVVVASEKDHHIHHPQKSFKTYLREIKHKVSEIFK